MTTINTHLRSLEALSSLRESHIRHLCTTIRYEIHDAHHVLFRFVVLVVHSSLIVRGQEILFCSCDCLFPLRHSLTHSMTTQTDHLRLLCLPSMTRERDKHLYSNHFEGAMSIQLSGIVRRDGHSQLSAYLSLSISDDRWAPYTSCLNC